MLSSPDGEVSAGDHANLEEFPRVVKTPALCELPHATQVDPALEATLARAVWGRRTAADATRARGAPRAAP